MTANFLTLYKKLAGSGKNFKDVAQPDHPSPPPSGWQIVNENSYKDITPSIPLVTTGTFTIR